MPESDERAVGHESLVQHAQALMIEALQLLDAAGAHQSASLLDHAICVLPIDDADAALTHKQSDNSN
jgi:hypothetical protein